MRIRVPSRVLVPVLLLAGFGPAQVSAGGPCAGVARAAKANRAGVVVQFSDLSVREYCVSFSESSITGFELLRRTKLALVFEDYGGGSVIVCKIAGDGCAYPRQQCFCACEDAGASCTFWGYYAIERDTGLWSFASDGAGSRRIRDGDVDGWRWGNHGTQGLSPPPPSDLSQICSRGTKIAARRQGGAAPSETGNGRPVAISTRGTRAPASQQPTPTGSDADTPSVEASGGEPPLEGDAAGARERSRPPATPGLAIVAFLALLAGLGVWAWLLSKQDGSEDVS